MKQKDLFDSDARADHLRRLSRTRDPSTSGLAARRHVEAGANRAQRAECYRALLENDGATSAELAEALGWDRHVTARRLPDLAADGIVTRGKPRTCRVKGSRSLTWWVVEEK